MAAPRREAAPGHLVDVNGVTFYDEADGQGESLVLLHAGSLTGETWRPYLPGFADRYRVITPDLPNHGRSGKPKRALSYRQLADEVVGFMQALDLRKPGIVGFSDGGQVALEIGMRYPALPRSIAIGGVWFKYSDTYVGGTLTSAAVPNQHVPPSAADAMSAAATGRACRPGPTRPRGCGSGSDPGPPRWSALGGILPRAARLNARRYSV